jgi:hypothetical protein
VKKASFLLCLQCVKMLEVLKICIYVASTTFRNLNGDVKDIDMQLLFPKKGLARLWFLFLWRDSVQCVTWALKFRKWQILQIWIIFINLNDFYMFRDVVSAVSISGKELISTLTEISLSCECWDCGSLGMTPCSLVTITTKCHITE